MSEKLDHEKYYRYTRIADDQNHPRGGTDDILDRKGIVSKTKLLEEMNRVQAAMVKSET